MIKKDFVRVKKELFKAKTKLEIEYSLGYEEALNNFGMLTRNQHYELFDYLWERKYNY